MLPGDEVSFSVESRRKPVKIHGAKWPSLNILLARPQQLYRRTSADGLRDFHGLGRVASTASEAAATINGVNEYLLLP